MIYDFIILGGGIVGVSTAWQLQQRFPDRKILLIEKESQLARHQTGHNSGVIHAGVYYAPGSLKPEGQILQGRRPGHYGFLPGA